MALQVQLTFSRNLQTDGTWVSADELQTNWGIYVSRGRTLADASPLRKQHGESLKAIPMFLASERDGGNLSFGNHPAASPSSGPGAPQCCPICSGQNGSFCLQQQMANLKQCATLPRWHATVTTVAIGSHRSLTSEGEITHTCLCLWETTAAAAKASVLLQGFRSCGNSAVFLLYFIMVPTVFLNNVVSQVRE